ncbi:MAG: hypothetical protein QM737_22775 [Ferruginibacter sp.]
MSTDEEKSGCALSTIFVCIAIFLFLAFGSTVDTCQGNSQKVIKSYDTPFEVIVVIGIIAIVIYYIYKTDKK